MPESQWNWYAIQELKGILAREGLRCPHCDTHSREILATEEIGFRCTNCNSHFTPAEYYSSQRRPPKTGESTLFRPVGENELAKIAHAEFKRFPARLPGQPIFYPVLTEDYAAAIARNWNSTDANHSHVGFVTRFQIRNEFLSNYEIQCVADRTTLEYWIPAEDLDSFNDNIVGIIEIIAEFRAGKVVERDKG